MANRIRVERYQDVSHDRLNSVAAEIDAIFFEASNTKVFATPETRIAFRQRWLGRYLQDHPNYVYLAVDGDHRIAGYLVGAIEDESTLGKDDPFARFVADFPAHLHINVAAGSRGRGVGPQLVAAFASELVLARVPGVHVITSAASDNVRFYRRNGFAEIGRGGANEDLVFLGRRLG